jgi:hypothetical protein
VFRSSEVARYFSRFGKARGVVSVDTAVARRQDLCDSQADRVHHHLPFSVGSFNQLSSLERAADANGHACRVYVLVADWNQSFAAGDPDRNENRSLALEIP